MKSEQELKNDFCDVILYGFLLICFDLLVIKSLKS